MKRFCIGLLIAGILVALVQVSRRGDWTASLRVPPYRQKGSPSAPIVITEFSDLQCPSCAKAEPALKDLLARHGDDVLFVFRHYPLTKRHKWAHLAAHAAESAGAQGRFWEYKEKLFGRQKEWEAAADALPLFLKYAAELGLDLPRFEADVKTLRWEGLIAADVKEAESRAVNSTPTFFINRRRISGETQLRQFGERFIELEKSP